METFTAHTSKLSQREFVSIASSYMHEQGFVWLDSSMHLPGRGKRSMLARRPVMEISYSNGEMTMRNGPQVTAHKLSVLGSLTVVCTLAEDNDLVAVGYISYESCLELADPRYQHTFDQTGFQFYLYPSVMEYDHETNEGTIIGESPNLGFYSPAFESLVERPVISPSDFEWSETHDSYTDKVNRIKRHIFEGDIYQANLTTRFSLRSDNAPTSIYMRLRSLTPAPYSAFLNFGQLQILSSSPERMLLLDAGEVSTSPIKGTMNSGTTLEEVERNRQSLLMSAKDRAELLMIVDLERNDLGRIAATGSVKVDALFRTELYRSLIHLVSDISAKVRQEIMTSQVLEALLPGGSITGAPKLRAIEILQSLESVPRGIYTGCIGYIRPGHAEFNIAIRTMVHQNGIYHIHAGGGIVADSEPDAEYDEMLLKASNMFRAIGLSEDQIACLRR